ncbi:MAG TPA: two-component regulator propeller domain-containing protein [Pricia sp.]|nr:two-component regulator propeller domain-containing protein [Pricia sp.]
MLFIQGCVFGQYTYFFNRYAVSDGLNTNKVNCVWQDDKGFLWIGTEVGIQRFDGGKFVTFFGNRSDRMLPHLGVEQILGAENGKLWLVQGSQIGLFDPFTFQYDGIPIRTRDALPPRNEVKLFKDSRGEVFLCASKYGLLRYDRAKKIFTDTDVSVRVPRDWGVNGLFEDPGTGEYFVFGDKGLALFDSGTGELFYEGNNPQHIPFFDPGTLPNATGFQKARDGTWWATYWDFDRTEQGSVVLHYDPGQGKMVSDTLGSRSGVDYAFLEQLLETRNGQLWIGGDNSLLTYESDLDGFRQQIKAMPSESDIRASDIRHLFEDREGNIWSSTENGLYVVNPDLRDVYNLMVIDGLKRESAVNALLETQDKENWIGTWGNGLLFYDARFERINGNPYTEISKADFESYGKVWDLCQHSTSGRIWAASQGGTLAVFDPDTKKALHWLRPPAFKGSTVRQVKEDKNGDLWFGTQGGHLVKRKSNDSVSNASFKLLHNFNTIINRLYFDRQGRLWVGTHKQGVYVIEPDSGTILSHFDEEFSDRFSVPDNSITDIQQYNDSIFFLGSETLNILNIRTRKVRRVTAYEGLNGSKVSQMMIDNGGVLWMITNNGLGSYNYENDMIGSYNNLHGIMYGERTNAAKCRMHNGEIWFGGGDVVFGFAPETLKQTEIPPNVTLTDLKLFNRFIPLDSVLAQKRIRFEHHQNSFTFYFSALNFNQRHKLQYYYRIPGINREWARAERDLAANYTTLPPGKYTFEVKSRNLQGLESPSVTAVHFAILPPFYGTWWFIALLSLILLSLAYLIYRLRVNRLLAVERLRHKVARDLHDDMGSTLSTINILSAMAKSKMAGDSVASSNYLTKIAENSQRMMEAMDDIVWSIKPNNDSMQRVVARMREYATGMLEAKDIGFEFKVDECINTLKLDMEARRDLFLIFKEAINNTAKYSRCATVIADIHCEGKGLYMGIRDNGAGFDVEHADTGNGLENMRKRAQTLRGQLHIGSSPEKGTEITLRMPLKKK